MDVEGYIGYEELDSLLSQIHEKFPEYTALGVLLGIGCIGGDEEQHARIHIRSHPGRAQVNLHNLRSGLQLGVLPGSGGARGLHCHRRGERRDRVQRQRGEEVQQHVRRMGILHLVESYVNIFMINPLYVGH